MDTCAYCNGRLGEVCCVGFEDARYCSAVCCERAEPDANRLRWERDVNWWVCVMVDRGGRRGGHFAVGSWEKPVGHIQGDHIGIAAGSYEVVYGPCAKTDADAYLDDVDA